MSGITIKTVDGRILKAWIWKETKEGILLYNPYQYNFKTKDWVQIETEEIPDDFIAEKEEDYLSDELEEELIESLEEEEEQ